MSELNTLYKLAKQQQLPHAMLISTTKIKQIHSSIRTFAQWLLCKTVNDLKPCNVCKICQLFHAETHPDFFEIIPEGSRWQKIITINRIRELKAFIFNGKPQFSTYKLAVIITAEYLNIQAANALLRILEEPPANTHLFLITINSKRLFETIVSRCILLQLESSDILHFSSEANIKQLIRNQIINDLYRLFKLEETHSVSVVESWIQHNPNQILEEFWIILTILLRKQIIIQIPDIIVKDNYHTKISEISMMQNLNILWPIFDKINAARYEFFTQGRLNIQLFLENLLISWLRNLIYVKNRLERENNK